MTALFTAFVTVAFVGVTNVVVDPFGRLGRNTLGLFSSSEREAKPVMVQRTPHDGLLLGSSRVAYIDPADIGGGKFFNAAFSSALPEEFANFLDLHGEGTKVVLLGLDFFMFNERAYPFQHPSTGVPEGRFGISREASYVFNINVFGSSLVTLSHALIDHAPPFLTPRGNRDATRSLARHNGMAGPDYAEAIRAIADGEYRNASYSERRIATLQSLKAVAAARGVRLIAFINPVNRDLSDAIDDKATQELISRFRRDMRAIYPDLVDFNDTGFVDPRYFFRFDPSHYLPATGAVMVNGLLGIYPSGLDEWPTNGDDVGTR